MAIMTAPAVGPFRSPDEAINFANEFPGITNIARRVYALIVHVGAATGHCFLSDEAIADRLDVHPGSVARVIKNELGPLGFFAAMGRGEHRGAASSYEWPKEASSPAALEPRTFEHVHDLLKAAGRDPAIRKSGLALALLIDLTHGVDPDGQCYRSIRKMAEDYGTDPNTIRRSLRRMIEGGWLTMVMRPDRVCYDFIFPIGPAPSAPERGRP